MTAEFKINNQEKLTLDQASALLEQLLENKMITDNERRVQLLRLCYCILHLQLLESSDSKLLVKRIKNREAILPHEQFFRLNGNSRTAINTYACLCSNLLDFLGKGNFSYLISWTDQLETLAKTNGSMIIKNIAPRILGLLQNSLPTFFAPFYDRGRYSLSVRFSSDNSLSISIIPNTTSVDEVQAKTSEKLQSEALERPTTETVGIGSTEQHLKESCRTAGASFGSVAIASCRGPEGLKERNEDVGMLKEFMKNGRPVVWLVAIDGVGGGASGDVAARILSEEVENDLSGIPRNVLLKAMDRMKGEIEFGGKKSTGAAISIAEITKNEKGKKSVRLFGLGDTQALVIKKSGNICCSQMDSAINCGDGEWHANGAKIGADERHYHPSKRFITNFCGITSRRGEKVHYSMVHTRDFGESIDLERGDIILVLSDGVLDNFTQEELQALIRDCTTEKEIITVLSNALQKRLENQDESIKLLENLAAFVRNTDLDTIKKLARQEEAQRDKTTSPTILEVLLERLPRIQIENLLNRIQKIKKNDIPNRIQYGDPHTLGRFILGCYPDGYLCKPKKDNATAGVMIV